MTEESTRAEGSDLLRFSAEDERRHARRHFWHFRRNRRLRRMIAAHGMHHARAIVRESARTGLPLAYSCAILQQESNGRNVFGCDHGFHASCPWCHQDVTKARVIALEKACWPHGLTNGVGPGQLTSTGFVREADAIGGSWVPRFNIRISNRIVRNLVQQFGEERGFNAYNGDPTGQYGRTVHALANTWQERINAVLAS